MPAAACALWSALAPAAPPCGGRELWRWNGGCSYACDAAGVCRDAQFGCGDSAAAGCAAACFDTARCPPPGAPRNDTRHVGGNTTRWPRDPHRFLFIGNSYTYYQDLPLVLKDFGHAAGTLDITHEAFFPGGSSLVGNAGSAEVARLLSQEWDIVVLQDQSQNPAGNNPEQYRQTLEVLRDFYGPRIRDAGASALLYQTWGRRDGDPVLGDFKTMTRRLREGYEEYARELVTVLGRWRRRVKTAQVGAGFEIVYDESSTATFRDLYFSDADGSHPSLQGTYLAAACMYAEITGHDPRGVAWAPSGLNAADAARLRDVAHRACA